MTDYRDELLKEAAARFVSERETLLGLGGGLQCDQCGARLPATSFSDMTHKQWCIVYRIRKGLAR